MKKIVFAIQVFGLVAIFPLYVVVELNRGTGALPVNDSPAIVAESPVKINIRATANSSGENENAVLDNSRKLYLSTNKISKKSK